MCCISGLMCKKVTSSLVYILKNWSDFLTLNIDPETFFFVPNKVHSPPLKYMIHGNVAQLVRAQHS